MHIATLKSLEIQSTALECLVVLGSAEGVELVAFTLEFAAWPNTVDYRRLRASRCPSPDLCAENSPTVMVSESEPGLVRKRDEDEMRNELRRKRDMASARWLRCHGVVEKVFDGLQGKLGVFASLDALQ
ncbi:hypothetical protein C8J56DRAFT_893540 [Mycena floridula]|nr:hypothetical protein C8J56DRAFT_893540 [Mycena floridula]